MDKPGIPRLLEERPLLASQPERAAEVAETLKILAHPTRLGILSILSVVPEAHVTALSGCLERSQSNISQHLRLLKDRGLVRVASHDGFAWYSLAEPEMAPLLEMLERSSLGHRG